MQNTLLQSQNDSRQFYINNLSNRREIQQDGVLMVKASRNRDEHVADVEPLCFYALFNWDILKELTNLANVL